MKTLKLDEKQLKIYEGLKSVGEEVAGFFLDGVLISKGDELQMQAYLLAHCAREIDGGIRDVLSIKDLESVSCNTCGSTLRNEKNTHQATIIRALDVDENSIFAKEWKRIASRFAKFAHRRGAYRTPRALKEFINLWKSYEGILFTLFGNYFALDQRIERLVRYEVPSEVILTTLPNLFVRPNIELQFYNKLRRRGWLKLLVDKGFFHPTTIPQETPDPENEGYVTVPYWAPRSYLLWVSSENYAEPEDTITDSLLKIINGYNSFRNKDGSRIKNRNVDYLILELLVNLPSHKIRDDHFELILHALHTENLLSSSLVIRTALPRFIEAKDKNLVNAVLRIIFAPIRIENGFQKFTSILHYTYLHYNIQKWIPGIVGVSGLEVYHLVHDFLIKELRYFEDDWIWYDIPSVSFESAEEDHDSFDKFHRLLVRFMTGILEEYEKDISKEIISLLESKWPIFRRVAIHLIDSKFDEYQELISNLPFNPFVELDSYTELACLIETQARNFSNEVLELIVHWLDEYKKVRLDSKGREVVQEDEDAINNSIHRWLNSLSVSNHPLVLLKLEEYEKLDGIGLEKANGVEQTNDFLTAQRPELLTFEDLSKKTIEEISDFFKPQEEPNVYGFIDYSSKEILLEEFVKSDQKLFFDNYKLFSDLPSPLCRKIITIVSYIWKNDNDFHYWEQFFRFP